MLHEGLDLSAINWRHVLSRLGVGEAFLTKRQGPCPICPDGGKDRFRFDDKEGKGTWYCNRCGAGNGITLVAKVNGWSNTEAFKAIMDEAHIVPLRPRIAASNSAPTRDELRSRLQKLWDEALPVVEGDPVWRYLNHRVPGLTDLLAPSEVRHHPSLEYFEAVRSATGRARYTSRGNFPVMLAKVRDKEGHPVNLHRTYLTQDGRKATILDAEGKPLEVKKMMTGVAKYTGGAVRLFMPDGSGKLGVGEGIETMLAVRAAYKGRIPVWPCLNEGGLRKFVIPEWVTELHIFADNDAPMPGKKQGVGQRAAAVLQRRANKEGFVIGARTSAPKRMFLHQPKVENTDFLDEWTALRKRRAA